MVNLTLKESVRYPFYIVVYRKRDHYIADLLVWGLLRLAPIMSLIFAKCHLIVNEPDKCFNTWGTYQLEGAYNLQWISETPEESGHHQKSW